MNGRSYQEIKYALGEDVEIVERYDDYFILVDPVRSLHSSDMVKNVLERGARFAVNVRTGELTIFSASFISSLSFSGVLLEVSFMGTKTLTTYLSTKTLLQAMHDLDHFFITGRDHTIKHMKKGKELASKDLSSEKSDAIFDLINFYQKHELAELL